MLRLEQRNAQLPPLHWRYLTTFLRDNQTVHPNERHQSRGSFHCQQDHGGCYIGHALPDNSPMLHGIHSAELQIHGRELICTNRHGRLPLSNIQVTRAVVILPRTKMALCRVTAKDFCLLGLVEGWLESLPVATNLNWPQKNGQMSKPHRTTVDLKGWIYNRDLHCCGCWPNKGPLTESWQCWVKSW